MDSGVTRTGLSERNDPASAHAVRCFMWRVISITTKMALHSRSFKKCSLIQLPRGLAYCAYFRNTFVSLSFQFKLCHLLNMRQWKQQQVLQKLTSACKKMATSPTALPSTVWVHGGTTALCWHGLGWSFWLNYVFWPFQVLPTTLCFRISGPPPAPSHVS